MSRKSILFTFIFLFTAVSGFSEPKTFQAAHSVLGQPDFVTDDDPDPPTANSMNGPEGVAVDPTTGKVFVSDSGNNRVLRFSSIAAYRTNAAAELVLGQPDFVSNDDNQGGARSAMTMEYPLSITVDSTGTLWVPDYYNNRVLRFDNASSITTNGAPADRVLGQVDFTTADPPTDPRFSDMESPTCATVDAAGTLWVVDSGNTRILRFDNAKGKADGADADGVLGQADLMTFDGSGTSVNQFSGVYGASVDRGGRLWVADSANNRVLRFDNASGKADGADADGVLGQADFDSIISDLSATTFNRPYYVFAAPNGTVWVSDYSNDRVLGFKAAAGKANGAAANVVLGQPNFTVNSADTPTAHSLAGPSQIAAGASGSLFVGDYTDSRILRFSDPVVIKAPRKVVTKNSRARIRGTSSGATLVKYRIPGQGRFKKAKGRAARWVVKARNLKKRKTVVRVQAFAIDNRRSPVKKTRVLMKR